MFIFYTDFDFVTRAQEDTRHTSITAEASRGIQQQAPRCLRMPPHHAVVIAVILAGVCASSKATINGLIPTGCGANGRGNCTLSVTSPKPPCNCTLVCMEECARRNTICCASTQPHRPTDHDCVCSTDASPCDECASTGGGVIESVQYVPSQTIADYD